MNMKKENNILGENLKRIREAAGMNQMELGELLDTGKRTVSDYETGKSTPNIHYIKRFCDHFGITIDSLVNINNRVSQKTSSEILITSLSEEEFQLIKDFRALDDHSKLRALQVVRVFRTASQSPEIQMAE